MNSNKIFEKKKPVIVKEKKKTTVNPKDKIGSTKDYLKEQDILLSQPLMIRNVAIQSKILFNL